MNRAFHVLPLLVVIIFFGCGGARLSHDEIRKQIAELGSSTLVPSAVSIRRVVNQSGNRAIAEANVDLAVQLERDAQGSPWHIASVRLGDGNWVPIAEFNAVMSEAQKRQTTSALAKLTTGVAAYRQRNGGSPPPATDIKGITDILHPQYMNDLVLDDAWGHPIEVEVSGNTIRFRSLGPDGKKGTDDDIVSTP